MDRYGRDRGVMTRCFNCARKITFESMSDSGNWECQDCGQELTDQANWHSKEYVCTNCDAYYTIHTKSDSLRDQNCIECEGMLILIDSKVIA